MLGLPVHDHSRLLELESMLGSHLALRKLGREQRDATIGRHRIDAMLGRGAFGLVARAHDPNVGRQVAIKCVPSSDPKRTFEQVASEAWALGQIGSPQVARVHDCEIMSLQAGDHSQRCVAIVMEYIDGVNLRRWNVRRHRREDVLEVLCNAARGLEAAHAANVVHRDFKPENVVVPSTHDARVVDFGLAYRLAGAPTSTTSLRPSGAVYGTRQYMAPEARRGVASTASDQFSFAVTAWELLAGCLPFEDGAESAAELRGAERLPWRLARVLRRALEPKPEQRFDDLAELREELEHFKRSPWQRSAPLVAGVAAVGAMAASFLVGARVGNRKKKNGDKA
jgi:serine/threonine protein kinase